MRRTRSASQRIARAAGVAFFCERLEGRTLLSALTINGTSGNDYISLDGTGGTLMKVDVNGVITNYNPFDYTSVVIQGVGGADTFNILANELPITIVGAGADVVDVGDGNGVQDINSSLNITDPPNYAAINLIDAGDVSARTITMTSSGTQGQVLGFAPVAITYATTDFSALNVTTGSAADTVNVLGTPTNFFLGSPQTSVTSTGAGIDDVTVGNATNGVQSILSPLAISGEVGFNTSNLTLDDTQDTTARSVSISSTAVTGLAPAAISYTPAGLHSLNMMGDSGGNGFTVASTVAGITTTLQSGPGNDAISVLSTASTGSLNIEGGVGLNFVTIGNAGSVQNILSAVSFVNAGNSDVITIDDSGDAVARNAIVSSVAVTNLAPAQIGYSLDTSLSLTIDGGDGGNTFQVTGTPGPGTVTNLNSGTGADVVNVSGTSQNSTLNIQGQTGADTVNITSLGSVQSVLGAVNVENTGSFTALTINDALDNVARNVTLSAFTPGGDTPFGSIAGLAPGVISYEVDDVNSPVVIDGGSGGNTFNVTGTPSGAGHTTNLNCGSGADHVNILGTGASTTLNVEGQGGFDVVNVGNSGSVQGVLGTVNITNGPAFSTVTIDDSADGSGRKATLSSFTTGGIVFGSVSGLCTGTINYRFNDVAGPITIDGGTGGNTFNVSAITPGEETVLNTGTGSDVVNVSALPSSATLTINGQGGNDTINLDYTSGNPLPHLVNLNGFFNVNGLSGVNTLNGTTMNIGRSTVYLNYVNPPSDPLASIRTYLHNGYNNGAWTGVATVSTGVITSAPAAGNLNHNTGIGWADSADGTGVNTTPDSIELKYTLNGDTNLNGAVDIFDLNALLPHFNGIGNWTGGDSTYNGTVDIFDLNAMLPNFNTTLGAQVVASSSSKKTGAQSQVVVLQHHPLFQRRSRPNSTSGWRRSLRWGSWVVRLAIRRDRGF